MNIINIMSTFSTQESCIAYLECKRWGDKPICPYCGSDYTNPLPKQLAHHCNGCRKSFRVTVGTIFHDTKIPLQKWFLLISLMMNAKKGLSACQAARDLGIRRPTVWSMMHRVRGAMKDNHDLFSGIVEMDETYIGGKPRKKSKKDDDDENNTGNPRGRGTKKTPVVGMVEREGRVRAKATNKHELKATDLKAMVEKGIDLFNSILMTDEYKGYNGMNKIVSHSTINHQKEYVRGLIHTNTIEGFWAIVKRGMMGQFHWVSKKYLQKYLNEFCYRYNARNQEGEVSFDKTIDNMLFC